MPNVNLNSLVLFVSIGILPCYYKLNLILGWEVFLTNMVFFLLECISPFVNNDHVMTGTNNVLFEINLHGNTFFFCFV